MSGASSKYFLFFLFIAEHDLTWHNVVSYRVMFLTLWTKIYHFLKSTLLTENSFDKLLYTVRTDPKTNRHHAQTIGCDSIEAWFPCAYRQARPTRCLSVRLFGSLFQASMNDVTSSHISININNDNNFSTLFGWYGWKRFQPFMAF